MKTRCSPMGVNGIVVSEIRGSWIRGDQIEYNYKIRGCNSQKKWYLL